MKKVIALIFMLCAISTLTTSGYLYLSAQDEMSVEDIMYSLHEDEYSLEDEIGDPIGRFDYAEELINLFPTSDQVPYVQELDNSNVGKFQAISNYMGLARDNFLDEVRSLEKDLEDETEAYSSFALTKESQVHVLEEIIAYLLLPLSVLLFLISIYFLVISFKNPTKITI